MTELDIIPIAANLLGLTPTTLLFGIFMVNQGAKVISRLIPDDARGALAGIRRVAKVLGADPSSRVTKRVTIKDAAKAMVDSARFRS